MIEKATLRRAPSLAQTRESGFRGMATIPQYREHLYRQADKALSELRTAKTPAARDRAALEVERLRKRMRRLGMVQR